MFVNWKNQYQQNDYTTQGNLQIQCNPYQITNGIFHRTRIKQKISRFVWRYKRPQIVKAFFSEKNRARGIRLPDFQLYYKAAVIKTRVLAQKQKYRPKEQDRKLENPEISPCTYG